MCCAGVPRDLVRGSEPLPKQPSLGSSLRRFAAPSLEPLFNGPRQAGTGPVLKDGEPGVGRGSAPGTPTDA